MQKTSRVLLGTVLALTVVIGAMLALVADALFRPPDFEKMKSSIEVPIYRPDGERATRVMGPKTASWVPIRQVSNHLLMAVIASEDTAFFQHDGVDFHELQEAIKKDIQEKRWARGASTITQQVIKNTFLTREKTLWRKIKEILWARQLDKAFTKSEILCFYVNLVEWGPGIYGIKAASSHYFEIPASDLSAKQAAFLAMLLPSPVKYYSYFRKKALTPWASKRVSQILRVMNRMSFITEEEYQSALSESLWGETPLAPWSDEALPQDEVESLDSVEPESELDSSSGTNDFTNSSPASEEVSPVPEAVSEER